MPFINSKVSVKLTKEKEKIISEKLGKAIELIPGKTEEMLMLGFEDNYRLYFKGETLENGAFIQVKISGKSSKEAFNNLTIAICDIFNELLDIPVNKIYINYEEVENWGYRKS